MNLGVAAAVVGGELVRGDVEVSDGVVASVGRRVGDGRGLAVPGLVDLQVNGYEGVDVLAAEPDELVEMGRSLARAGVLWYQPTLITAPPERTRATLDSIGAAITLGGGATIVGAHLEGPFLSPARPGAHAVEWLRDPNKELLASYLLSGCPVTMMTVAPELPDADEIIDALVERGVVVSVGHTDATSVAAQAAFDLGARSVTHLFNAMRPFTHRDPGTVGAALARDDVVVQLIADGVHLSAESILMAWRAARGRVVLVSDAIAAAGLGDGSYRVGDVEIEVENGVSRTADGTLAGAVRPLEWGMRALVELGVPIPEAVAAVTSTPARLVGRPEAGRLELGGPADLVVLDDDLVVTDVLQDGTSVLD